MIAAGGPRVHEAAIVAGIERAIVSKGKQLRRSLAASRFAATAPLPQRALLARSKHGTQALLEAGVDPNARSVQSATSARPPDAASQCLAGRALYSGSRREGN